MKKLVFLFLAFFISQTAFAIDSAKLRIRLSSSANDNRYFLCVSGIGCLSVLKGRQGKMFPIIHPIDMDQIYIADATKGLELSPQGLPASCNVKVNINQTLTITGNIVNAKNGHVAVQQLRCSLS